MTEKGNDWRVKLFGDEILLNESKEGPVGKAGDREKGINVPQGIDAIPLTSSPVKEYFEGYDYIAVFFGYV